MKETPTVCAIMLVNGREEMVKRAIKSFREQTYQKKRLFVFDTGLPSITEELEPNILHWHSPQTGRNGWSIGILRNMAIDMVGSIDAPWKPDVIVHLDSDDWSHPRRIEEQVALLQTSGKECVGYKDMLFYDTTPGQFCGAWLYRHATKPLGTSLMYWRSVWEQRPFPDLPKAKGGTGEDVQWLEGVDHLAVPSVLPTTREIERTMSGPVTREQIQAMKEAVQRDDTPRMIASIHGGNTQYYDPAEYERQSNGTSWKRAAEFDKHCQKVMAL